jgi:tetratricopeptide (TPR) repeat protein
MKKKICVILFLVSFAGYSQTYNKYAKEYSIDGSNKVSRKDYAGAVEDLTKAIMLDSAFKQAYENRGVAKFYLQDYKGSIDDYTKALEIDPNDYTTFGRRGWAKFYLHDYTGAITDLDKAVSGSKDKFRYCNFRGQAKFKLKDYDGAITDFSSVISSWSSDKEQKNKALYWRGVSKIITGQKESGCLDLKKAGKSGFPDAEAAMKLYCNN